MPLQERVLNVYRESQTHMTLAFSGVIRENLRRNSARDISAALRHKR